MLVFGNEFFEDKGDMLLFALEEGIVKDTDIFDQMRGMAPDDVLQLALDYGNIDEICASLLEFDEIVDWED